MERTTSSKKRYTGNYTNMRVWAVMMPHLSVQWATRAQSFTFIREQRQEMDAESLWWNQIGTTPSTKRNKWGIPHNIEGLKFTLKRFCRRSHDSFAAAFFYDSLSPEQKICEGWRAKGDFDGSKFCVRNYDLIVPNPVYALIGAYLFGRLCGFLWYETPSNLRFAEFSYLQATSN